MANGAQIERDLAALGVPPHRIAAFPNGVLLPDAAELAKTLTQRAGNRFVFAGRLVSDKRPHVLVEAAIRLATAPSPPLLVMLGDGPEEAPLAALASARGASNVVLQGYVEDVYPHLLTSDFFVSASMREGQSDALLEAMSAGVILIICGASGATDVVTHGVTGYIVEKSEPDAFAAALRWALGLTGAERETMALACRSFAERHIGIDAMAAKTIDMIESLRT